MGDEVEERAFSSEDRTRHREKIRRSLDVLARLLRSERFESARPMTGMEVELHLVDGHGDPASTSAEVLETLDDEEFQTELGQFNLEINLPPVPPGEGGLGTLEAGLLRRLARTARHARAHDSQPVMIGILPTLREEHLQQRYLSDDPRYRLLEKQILRDRGEHLRIRISGRERVDLTSDTIMPEAACTSAQFHVQVRPEEFGQYWNAAQAIAGFQLAVGANSPYLLGQELWRETRIPLFEQATDTRREELKAQGVRPRVWFGERWITSVFDLFEENVRFFPALLPVLEDEDPVAVLDDGGVPTLPELRLHNGTVYRWNRPVYDVVDDGDGPVPHLRVENRVLAAGPTVLDTMANHAFFLGLVRALAEAPRSVWTRMPFEIAEQNFHLAARLGVDAQLAWPEHGQAPATEIVLRELLPLAHSGLSSWGVDQATAGRLLGVIEGRCERRTNGAAWFVGRVRERLDAGEDRHTAQRAALLEYCRRADTGDPVHTWV
ncbi:glutamate--cysteine ligase [Nocardioides insulae]|uniref:glutamate--cysteine ligase n=1 Tax=Nocardioides insulae TaxID=394734 RepID=UPI0004267029|nr:glutamate--cysteine ligase [Nocardioides insulae]